MARLGRAGCGRAWHGRARHGFYMKETFMKPLIAVFLTLVCALSSSAQFPITSVCSIQTARCEGSGTLIGVRGQVGLVLTCRHVAGREGAIVKCVWVGGQETLGVVLRVLAGNGYESDQALVMCVRPANVWPVEIAKFDLVGPWTSIGWRNGRMYVQRHSVAVERDSLIKLQGPYVKGQSGGAVFNRHGKLVGIIVASDFVAVGYASDGERLHNMVKQFKRGAL